MSGDKTNTEDSNEGLFEQKTIVVDPGQKPLRIDKFLMDRLERVSRNQVQNAIRAGAVLVDDKEIKPNFKVKPGHVIQMLIPKSQRAGEGVLPENIPLDIRYEDDDIMVVHKPAGLVVHPGVGNWTGTLVNALAYHYQENPLPVLDGNQNDRLGLVHRIDKDTSGLLVIAKSDYAMSHLAKQFFNHTVERTYVALIWGEPEETEGRIEANIGRHPKNRKEYTTFPDGDEGKWAVTHYKLLEPMYYVSLIQCNLETGRTHQIRVHMKHLGHPLFNDERYGGNRIVKGTVFSKYRQFVENCFKIMPRQALHAKSLGFVHPITGEQMYFEADLPEDFQGVLDKWKVYINAKRGSLG
jgi:23S rRNA pseudouridine1911/1915/1917 synthase